MIATAARWAPLAAFVAALASATPSAAQPRRGLEQIDTIVVIYLENRSFDHLFGRFPGAEGLAKAGRTAIQVDENGKPYAQLPPVLDLRQRPAAPYAKLPATLPNAPFSLDNWYGQNEQLGSLIHAFYQQQAQIAGGRMNRYVLHSDAKGYAMATWDGSKLELWRYARKYALADHFFHAAFGGSFLNHFWLVCACTPVYPNAPAEIVAVLDATGKLVKDGAVSPDGFAVNTLEPIGGPHNPQIRKAELLPVQDMPTIGDRLSAKGVSWKWYSGGWNEAEAGTEKPGTFSYHHQPFAFFKRFQKGNPDRQAHIKDLDDLLVDIDAGTLPAVAFYKPRRGINQHPSASNVADSDRHLADILGRLERGKQWSRMAIVVTYDENGGFWDHVSPPRRDRFGPGARVPTVIVSPFARRGHVEHTSYDTTAILKLIEKRHGLAPLTAADAGAGDLTRMLRFAPAP